MRPSASPSRLKESEGIEEDGFIVCERDTHSPDAIDFMRKLAVKTGCDIVYDGMVFVQPDELTPAWESERNRRRA